MADHGVVCSMSRSGNVWDNAAMESFFSSLKTERTARKVYRSRNEAKADVFDYIERFYNPKRRHSTIGYSEPYRVRTEGRISLSRCQQNRVQLNQPVLKRSNNDLKQQFGYQFQVATEKTTSVFLCGFRESFAMIGMVSEVDNLPADFDEDVVRGKFRSHPFRHEA